MSISYPWWGIYVSRISLDKLLSWFCTLETLRERLPIRLNIRSHWRIRNWNFRRWPHLESSTKRIEYLGSSLPPCFRAFSTTKSDDRGWSDAKARGYSASIVLGFGSPINYFAHVSISIKKQKDVTHILSLKQQKPFYVLGAESG